MLVTLVARTEKALSAQVQKSLKCIDISNLGLSDGNLGYQLTSLTSLKNFDISGNNLSNQIPYDLPPNLETVNAEKSTEHKNDKSKILNALKKNKSCFDVEGQATLVTISDSVEGKSVHDTKNAQKESSNNEPSTTDDVKSNKESVILVENKDDNQTKTDIELLDNEVHSSLVMAMLLIQGNAWLSILDQEGWIGYGVPWSNERPLENKELNAIIGAWFTLWRD
ncbi:STRUBBELIG-receptor family 6-like protein isoform X1 [Tanacetum coccineum]|uniref:STRUBBELIG-receptor family 6-like protein isoform X1 n=1 Tax=Tanacetum coccineum TaxID=301880 RepID=A0ABQ5D6A3_9ASTR